MAPEKVTKMVVHVDLKCSDCYKKVKKVICKIPAIRDQEYDFEKNMVKISVVCCSPDNIKDKLCYKGGTSIQKIEIVAADKAKKPKESEKPKGDVDKPKTAAAAAKCDVPKVAKMTFEPPEMVVNGYPPPTNHPMQHVVGYAGLPFQHLPSSSSGYGYAYNSHDGYNGNATHYPTGDYFSEENPQGCSLM